MTTWPRGRSSYDPRRARVGELTPQSDPDRFSTEDLLAEASYLMETNRRDGPRPSRTAAYLRLVRIIAARPGVPTRRSPSRARR